MRLRSPHGFPAKIRISAGEKSLVRILVKNGIACEEFVEGPFPRERSACATQGGGPPMRDPRRIKPVFAIRRGS